MKILQRLAVTYVCNFTKLKNAEQIVSAPIVVTAPGATADPLPVTYNFPCFVSAKRHQWVIWRYNIG